MEVAWFQFSSRPAIAFTLNFPTTFILMVIVWVSSANKDGRNDTQQILHTDRFWFNHIFFSAQQALYIYDIDRIIQNAGVIYCSM